MKHRLFSMFALLGAFFALAAVGSCQNGPTTSQTFHYAVTAVSTTGESAFSNDVAATIPNDGKVHSVDLNFVQSATSGVIKNCWYRGSAAGSYSLPGTCSTAPVTAFVDGTLATVAPPSPPTGLGFILAKTAVAAAPVFADARAPDRVFKSKDGKLVAVVH